MSGPLDGKSSLRARLEKAWERRESLGLFADREALRVFHGPGEGTARERNLALDRFGAHYWLTYWEKDYAADALAGMLEETRAFLADKGAQSAVFLKRPEKGLPPDPEAFFGTPPAGRFEVREGRRRFWIQLLGAKHPGLFLDHAPWRDWLEREAGGWRVLNTFAYTGSLSVAAGLGGAAHVTTLDLSKATTQWAQENWELNGLPLGERARFVYGDVFEWLPRWRRDGLLFDCVILDPPSFSRGKKGDFSTARDLVKLHALALGVLREGGVLMTSINSANISWSRYEQDVQAAARECGVRLAPVAPFAKVELPESFPTRPERPEDRYLKGWILRMSSGSSARNSRTSRDIG